MRSPRPSRTKVPEARYFLQSDGLSNRRIAHPGVGWRVQALDPRKGGGCSNTNLGWALFPADRFSLI